MMEDIKDQKEIVLGNQKYIVYLKEVATKQGRGEVIRSRVIRAFVKRV